MRLAGALQGGRPRGLDAAITTARDCGRGEGVGGSVVVWCRVVVAGMCDDMGWNYFGRCFLVTSPSAHFPADMKHLTKETLACSWPTPPSLPKKQS